MFANFTDVRSEHSGYQMMSAAILDFFYSTLNLNIQFVHLLQLLQQCISQPLGC